MSLRGQAAIEFLILSGFMLIVFTTFFFVIQERSDLQRQRQQGIELQSIADVIEQEVLLASQVSDGYNRTFELPRRLAGREYDISLYPASGSPSEVVVRTSEEEYIVFLAVNLTADSRVQPGFNQITKMPGEGIFIREGANPEDVCWDAGKSCSNPDGGKVDPVTCECECSAGFAECGGQCIDLESSVDNCGSCGNACPSGESCVGGSCSLVCTGGTTKYGFNAGGTRLWAATAGTLWGARTQITNPAEMTVCCDSTTRCAAKFWCPALGVSSFPGGRHWVCEDTGVGPEFFQCTASNDGRILDGSTGRFCCSMNSTGQYAFNSTPVGSKDESALCSDASDNDCDGLVDQADPACPICDADGDGYDGSQCGGSDCDDGDATVNPGINEGAFCSDGKDNDCDGEMDYDGADSIHGDASCQVQLTGKQIPAVVTSGEQFSLNCSTSPGSIRCVYPQVPDGSCSFTGWTGNKAKFSCMPPTVSTQSTKTFGCIVATYCYSSGTNPLQQNVVVCPAGQVWSGTQCITPVCDSDADCNDFNVCTQDTCNNPGTASASCSNSAVPSGTWCGSDDRCSGGVCIDCDQDNDNYWRNNQYWACGSGSDCNDLASAVNPGESEAGNCFDDQDNDCNGFSDGDDPACYGGSCTSPPDCPFTACAANSCSVESYSCKSDCWGDVQWGDYTRTKCAFYYCNNAPNTKFCSQSEYSSQCGGSGGYTRDPGIA